MTVAVDLVTICFLFNLFRAAKKSNWETEDETFPLKHLEDGILIIFLWPLHLIIIEANATRKMEGKFMFVNAKYVFLPFTTLCYVRKGNGEILF